MNLKHDFLKMGLQKFHKVFFSVLLIVEVFPMVKLGLGVVTVWSNLKHVTMSSLKKTLVKMKKSWLVEE